MNGRFNLFLLLGACALTFAATIFLQDAPPRQSVPAITNVPVDGATTAFTGAQRPTPEALMQTLTGEEIALSSYRGKIVLLNFWASWCIPCAVEYPQMIRLADMMGDDLIIIAVSSDAERPAIDRFIQRHGTPPANFIITHDPDKRVTQDIFGTIRLPETIIIDPAGIMREKIIGASVEWDDAPMIEKLRGLIPARD